MFLFGSNGSSGQSDSGAVGDLHQEILDRDEEIAELKAKIEAYRDALEKEPHFDHFEMAMEEKNKVLEEQFAKVEELRKENQSLLERLQHGGPEGAHEGPESGSPEMEEKRQVAEVVPQAQEASVELRAQLDAAHQELEELRASTDVEESARTRTENLELRARLAHAIYCTTEAQKALATETGQAMPTEEELTLTLDNAKHVGVMFGPREGRELGRGWQVMRVREGTWAEQAGVQAGDELHYVDGQPIEVLPEAEVLALLQKRPVELTWIRRQAVPERTGEASEASQAQERTTNSADADLRKKLQDAEEQNRALEDQLKRLSMELGKVQAGDFEDVLRERQAKLDALQDELSRVKSELESRPPPQIQPALDDAQDGSSKDLRERVQSLEEQLSTAEAARRQADEARAALELEVADAEAQRAAALQDAAGASTELQQQLERLQSEAAQVPDLRDKLAELEANHESALQAQASAEHLQHEVERLKAEAADAQAQRAAMEADQASLQEAAGVSAELQEQLQRLQSEAAQVPELQGKLVELEATGKAAQERALQAQASTEQLQLEVERLKAEAAQVPALKAQIADAEAARDPGAGRTPEDGGDGWGDELDLGVGGLGGDAGLSGVAAAATAAVAPAAAEETSDQGGWDDFDLEDALSKEEPAKPATSTPVDPAEGQGWDDFDFEESLPKAADTESGAAVAAADLEQLERLRSEAAQVPDLQSRLAELEAKHASALQAQASAEELQHEVQRLRAEADAANSKVSAMEAQQTAALHDAAGASAELQQQLETIKLENAQVPELRGKLAQLEAEYASALQAQASAEQLQSEVERLKTEAAEVPTLKAQIATVEAQRAALQEAAGTSAELRHQVEKLQSEADKVPDLQSRLAELEAKHESALQAQASAERRQHEAARGNDGPPAEGMPDKGSDGWGDDFDLGDGGPSTGDGAPVPSAVATGGGEGWDDFDFDLDSSAPASTEVKVDANLGAPPAEDEDGGDGWADDGLDLEQLPGGDGGLTMGDTGGPQVFDMAVDDDLAQEATANGDERASIEALRARITELEGQLVHAQDARDEQEKFVHAAEEARKKALAEQQKAAEEVAEAKRQAREEQDKALREAEEAKTKALAEQQRAAEEAEAAKLEAREAQEKFMREVEEARKEAQAERQAAEEAENAKLEAARLRELNERVCTLQEQLSSAEASRRKSDEAHAACAAQLAAMELQVTQLRSCQNTASEAPAPVPAAAHAGDQGGWDDFDVEEFRPEVGEPVPTVVPASEGAQGQGLDDFDFEESVPKAAEPVSKAMPAESEGQGWDDFDFEESVPKAAEVSKAVPVESEGQGWDDFDFEESVPKAAEPISTTAPADSGGEGWDDFQLDGAAPTAEPASRAADESRGSEGWGDFDLDVAHEKAAATDSREHGGRDESSAQAVSMFSTATRLFGTATSMAQAARAAAESTFASPHEEMRPTEGTAVVASDAHDDAAGARLEGAALTASKKRLEEELEVLKARLTMAQDQLKAERAAHSHSATKALSGEVAALSEALIRERQEFEREKVQLNQHLQQAKEDLQHAAFDEGRGDLSQQIMQLRRQRDQARGVAQCIARQVSVLAEELSALRRGGEAVPNASAPEPEQTLLQMDAAAGGVAVTANGPMPEGSTTSQRDPTEEGDEGSAPRPPVEITSGWDVFNPDDQLEHTIPTGRTEPARNGQDGWGDFDFDDLM